MLNRASFLPVLLALLLSGHALAQAPLDVSTVSDLQSVTPNIAYLRYEQSESFTADEVLAGAAGEFQPIPGQEVSFGYSSDHFWFAIDTINRGSEPIDLLLDTNIKFLSPLIIYEVDGRGERRELLFNDERQVFANRPKNTPRLTVPISWLPGEEKQLLLYATSGSGMDLRLQIGPEETVVAKYSTRLIFYAFFGGVLLSLILINLFYYYAVRRVAHLLYAFQEISIVLFMMHIDGFAFQYLWPDSPTWNAHATMFFGHLIIVASSLFSISFLELKSRAPLFYRLGQVIGVVGAGMLLLTPWIEPQLSHQVGLVTTAVGSIIFFIASCLVSVRGHRPARYFLAGWLFLSLGAVIYGFANLGLFVLPIDPLLVLRLGVLLEGLLLSYGLSDQLKVLQEKAALANESLLRSTERRLEEAIEHVKIEQENARTKEEMLRKDLEIARSSHDIRQPISSLRMALLGLLRNQKDPGTAEVFNRTLDHMEQLLGDRISGAASDSEVKALNYGEFIEQTVAEFSGEAVAQGMELRHVASSLPLTEPQIPLKRVLNNLLVNALRHSRGSRVLLGVRRRQEEVELMVIDDGEGDFESTSDNSGAGLGLGIVRELCKENDWQLAVESIHGPGHYIHHRNSTMNIGIADDHELFRMGLKLLLQSVDGCAVVLEASSGNALLQQMGDYSLDVLIIDYSMGDGSGLDVLKHLKELESAPKAILLTATATNIVLQQALELGASALVAKAGSGEEVLNAVSALAGGRRYISSDFDALLAMQNQLDSLTTRENEVLLKLIEGHSTRAVAEQLSISFKTAETHRTRLMQKLDIHSVAELMQFAHSSGLLTPG